MTESLMKNFKVNTLSLVRSSIVLTVLISSTGCTTIGNAYTSTKDTIVGWFVDEEEQKIRNLEPIEMKFEPTIVWDKDLGKGVDDFFSTLRPVYAYETLYAAERHGIVAAMDPETGETKWERNFAIFKDDGYWDKIARLWRSGASAKISAINVGYNRLFIGSENGQLIALKAESGELDWQITLDGEILAKPAMDEGILVVNTGAGDLLGIEATTGEILWQSEGDVPPLSLRGVSAPNAANGGAITGTANGKLQVNIINSGLLAWEAAVTTPSGATELERMVDVDTAPLVVGGSIYVVSFNGSLAAVDMRSGRVIWKREYASYRNVSVSGNMLFVVDNNASVYAIDRRNGVEIWSQSTLKGRSLTGAEPFGDYVVVGDNWGFVHWLDKETGKMVSRVAVGDDDDDESIYAAPVVVGNKVFATTRDGVIAAVTIPE